MFKLMSATFTTGVAIGATSVLIAIRRGHMHLEPNEPETADTDVTGVENDGAGNDSDTEEPVAVDAERLSS